MSLFAISDLHLPGSHPENKSMAVFGSRWIDSVPKLVKNWTAVVGPSDSVVIPGDISWAMTLEEAKEDFALLQSLPGIKYMGKGNHDFWWTTAQKMNDFFNNNRFDTLRILYNNSYILDGIAVCGSRGWFADEANQKTVSDTDWEKITSRETTRLGLSLASIPASMRSLSTIAFLHFPPVWNGCVSRGIIDILHSYSVTTCCFGHIHNMYTTDTEFEFEGIRFFMISADYLNFSPKPIVLSKDAQINA